MLLLMKTYCPLDPCFVYVAYLTFWDELNGLESTSLWPPETLHVTEEYRKKTLL